MLSKVRANGGLTVPYGDLASWIKISSLSSGSLSLLAPAGILVAPDKTPILDKCTAINFTLYGRPVDAALTLQLRTVAVRDGPFSMSKSHLKLVAPTEVNRTVAPVRRQNANFELGST
jgi:hypothetical protein